MALDPLQLGAALLEAKLLSPADLEKFQKRALSENMDLEELLFNQQSLPEKQLTDLIAQQYGVPLADLADATIKESLLNIVPYRVASHQLVIPFEQDVGTIKVAMNHPDNYELINFIENKTGFILEPYYAPRKDILLALKAYNRDVNEKFNKLLEGVLEDHNDIESLQDASKIVDTIILFAQQNRASDIHLEPHKNYLVVRYRVDGILSTIAELPISIADVVTTRIKVLAQMRTDEHRAAQDGRFKIELEGTEITLRVSIIPTYDGEKVVMRLLSATNQELNLNALGYRDENLKIIQNSLKKTNGIILMTGPTGSGKTTTLYSMLKMLNSPEVNISTIEDPIEYRLEGINQTQVNRSSELDFANGLRSLLRQDPDIIMVGEIRDEETATVAINAALTGHLVFATLHTNDATSTLPRMLEMGVESFLLAATIKLVVAQRLIRTICEHCKESYTLNMAQLADLGQKFQIEHEMNDILAEFKAHGEDACTLYRGAGCEVCGGTGYRGRTTIAEVMPITDTMGASLNSRMSAAEMRKQAVEEGMITMFKDGILKVLDGRSTIEEVLRVMRA